MSLNAVADLGFMTMQVILQNVNFNTVQSRAENPSLLTPDSAVNRMVRTFNIFNILHYNAVGLFTPTCFINQ